MAFLVDTNILVHRFDPRFKEKQRIAKRPAPRGRRHGLRRRRPGNRHTHSDAHRARSSVRSLQRDDASRCHQRGRVAAEPLTGDRRAYFANASMIARSFSPLNMSSMTSHPSARALSKCRLASS